jgi:hypothetical protein
MTFSQIENLGSIFSNANIIAYLMIQPTNMASFTVNRTLGKNTLGRCFTSVLFNAYFNQVRDTSSCESLVFKYNRYLIYYKTFEPLGLNTKLDRH